MKQLKYIKHYISWQLKNMIPCQENQLQVLQTLTLQLQQSLLVVQAAFSQFHKPCTLSLVWPAHRRNIQFLQWRFLERLFTKYYWEKNSTAQVTQKCDGAGCSLRDGKDFLLIECDKTIEIRGLGKYLEEQPDINAKN